MAALGNRSAIGRLSPLKSRPQSELSNYNLSNIVRLCAYLLAPALAAIPLSVQNIPDLGMNPQECDVSMGNIQYELQQRPVSVGAPTINLLLPPRPHGSTLRYSHTARL